MSDVPTKILIVDRDDDILWMLSARLSKEHAVLTASDTHTALSALSESAELSAIIVDQELPGIGAMALLGQARSLCPYAARILIAQGDRGRAPPRSEDGVHVHRLWSKPLRMTELPGMLRDAIREARLEAENAALTARLAARGGPRGHSEQELEERVRQRTAELERRLNQLSLRDELTGLFNHRYAMQALEIEVSRACRYARDLGVLRVKLDSAQPIGDALLKCVSELLTGGGMSGVRVRSRASDIVARYADDEFVLILPETALDGCLVKAERISDAIRRQHNVVPRVGVSTFPEDGSDAAALIEAAGAPLSASLSAARRA